MKKIAVIGECMIELTQRGGELTRSFGGDTLNTAVYMARQAAAATLQVSYVTGLGNDSFSAEMQQAWQQEGIAVDLIQHLPDRLPGLYLIETDPQGERTFYYWRSEAAARFWLESEGADAVCRQLAGFDYLYLSGISLAILSEASREKLFRLLAGCRGKGGRVIFDNNYRPRLWADTASARQIYQLMLEQTDLAFLTLDDETALWGDEAAAAVLERTHRAGVHEVVIKRGADPCLVSLAGEPVLEVPALTVDNTQVIDTTAAGDSFSAGYLAARLSGTSARRAAQQGHLLASHVIQHPGAIIPREAMPLANADNR
ncbi:ketodeoxygluconokinase [Erwinia sp. OLTSP20]|uniref:sugar kinase n=1 Tax=unclassified Erwinia TaxID=2622719 RepID=UPI000C1868EA|nr:MULTISPECIES: sugar kinase [unclassified Erwinia]PIJ50754.1 ketodeoxygluconokinase [Erwinia sp. OAMSP11]PIJ75423.1 ketodeoxygluconokinase [Erwinia sp. OLSSP12]PIJ81921.1 ketodeoxygluconokinase [Erwinia sp. OLCASP19]PIJ84576.1 ketodeoxygluconokinase [Erwinia sp. OLMTSP26]PIJ86923.1 ketodeoxygluconokinase [Erwinia sp. OLMDSP33]